LKGLQGSSLIVAILAAIALSSAAGGDHDGKKVKVGQSRAGTY